MSMVLRYGTVAVLIFFPSYPIRELSTMTEEIIENEGLLWELNSP